MARCIQILKACQSVDSVLDYAFNLTDEFANVWGPDLPFAAAVAVRPTGKTRKTTGFEYSSSGGQSNGTVEPAWPIVNAGTVADGSIATWTAQVLSNTSLEHRIDTCVWSAPAGITVTDEIVTETPGLQEVRLTVSGGTAGTTYTISGLITTTDGLEFEVRLQIEIVE